MYTVRFLAFLGMLFYELNCFSMDIFFYSQAQTQYGQVCCYDEKGYLMHTHYQPLVKTSENYPYSPGFPQRAFELGTEPFQSQFQVRRNYNLLLKM